MDKYLSIYLSTNLPLLPLFVFFLFYLEFNGFASLGKIPLPRTEECFWKDPRINEKENINKFDGIRSDLEQRFAFGWLGERSF